MGGKAAHKAGRAHASEVAASLVGRAAAVTVAEPVVGKDVSEHLGVGRTIEQLTVIASTDRELTDGGTMGLSDWLRTATATPSLGTVPSHVLAASWWDSRETLKDLSYPVRIDLSAADAHDVTGVPEFEQLLTSLGTGKLVHRFTLYRGENHNSIRTLSFPAGLYWVYADKS